LVLKSGIEETHAVFTVQLSMALKYRKQGVPAEIIISAKSDDDKWTLGATAVD
jgi:hypothetical protein